MTTRTLVIVVPHWSYPAVGCPTQDPLMPGVTAEPGWYSRFERHDAVCELTCSLHDLDLPASSRKYLEPYRPSHLGCDVNLLFEEMADCFAEVLASTEDFPRLEINPELIPEIHLDPAGP